MSALDADALATLTPEEREAIEADDMTADDRAALAAVAGDTPPARNTAAGEDDDADDDEDDDEDDDDPAGDAAGAAPVEGQPAAGDAAADADDADDEPPAERAAPRYQAELPADYDERIQGLKTRDAELRQKFKDGEIDIDERDAGLAEIAAEREGLLVARAKAEISQEMTQQTAQEQWRNTVARSIAEFAKPENGGLDYRKDKAAMEALDEEVKALAQMPRHANKPMDWFLAEAHKRVMLERGMAMPQPKPTPSKDPVADAKARRKPPVSNVPANLSQVPGSDGPGDVGDEFADILALDGVEYEDAIGRLARTDPAKFDRFMRGR